MTKLRSVVFSLLAGGVCLAWGLPAYAQMAPEETVKTLKTAPGFDVSLFASEPMITNPAAIDVDTQGRVWVAEIQWYRGAAKNPPADKIKVLEDTDGDGKADKSTVFTEGVFAPMSICVAGDKVYVATSPDLWMFEDKNGDLKADGPPTKLLTGFGGQNHDHGAHSLVLGPDHKWWMSHGDTGFNVTGTDNSHIEFRFGAMLRGELDGSKLETVAVNFRNPYEISISSFGEAFCSDNDNDGNFSVRICWILEGGNYGWFGGPPFSKEEIPVKAPLGTPFAEHWHFRGHLPGYVPATLVTGFGSPCGMCFYEGDAFGPDYRNAPLHADAGPREVRIYRHEQAGYGMKATSENVVTTEGDNYFRPDDVCTAPDGSVLMSDWYDGGVGGHAYNDPDRGRIYMLRPSGRKLDRVGKAGPFENVADAIEGLKNPNLATQYLARERLLAEGQGSVQALNDLLSDQEPNNVARALWVLDRIGGEARQPVVEQLKSSDATLRALAVRILRRHGEEHAEAILALSKDESDEVKREVLLAIRTLPGEQALNTLAEMASTYDGQDRYQLEAIHVAAGERKAELYAKLDQGAGLSLAQLPLMQLLNPEAAANFLMAGLNGSGLDAETGKTLLEAAGNIPAPQAGRNLLKLLRNNEAAADLRRLALDKLNANLSGNWKELATDREMKAALLDLLQDEALRGSALAMIGTHGVRTVDDQLLALATGADVAAPVREQAIQVAAKLQLDNLGEPLEKLLNDSEPAVRTAALNALVDLQDGLALRRILTTGHGVPEVRAQAVERLMTSTGGALLLLRLVEDDKLPQELKTATIAKAGSHPDSNVRVLFEQFIPEDQRPQRLGSAIKAEDILALDGDAARGEQIFFQSSAAQCKNCHRVQGVGTTLGPDLSQIGKKYERKTLLETILEPSKAIAPEFIPYLVETESGQVYAGFMTEKTDQHVVLRDAKNELIRIAAEDIAELAPQQKSLMPELVLRDVTAQDAADLLAYLTSLTTGVEHVSKFRVLGPFDSADAKGLDKDFGLEQDVNNIDLNAEYPGLGDKTVRWEEVAAENNGGFLYVDQVKYCQAKGLQPDRVTNYFLTYADSAADQDVSLLIGSDDSCRVWVNGQEVHRYVGSRALAYAQDKVQASLKSGRNTILIKVENYNGPGGVSLSLGGPARLDLKTQ